MKRGILSVTAAILLASAGVSQQKSYRLPSVDLKQQVIWGSTCDGPDNTGLAFGGQDQKADDGQPHTRIKVDGQWKAIHEELRANNPHQQTHEAILKLRESQKRLASYWRRSYLGASSRDSWQNGLVAWDHTPRLRDLVKQTDTLATDLDRAAEKLKGGAALQARAAASQLRAVRDRCKAMNTAGPMLKDVKSLAETGIELERAATLLAPEPPPRALSPIIYDAKTKLYVLFGGDHLDYLMNDTWVFDPARKKWELRQPEAAPQPRGNHQLKAAGDGKATLSGGYTYTSSTDYLGGQYRDLGDGDWSYDIAANTWTGGGKSVEPNARVYRTGPFQPEYFLEGPKPDRTAFQKQLEDLPANTWVATKPPHLPRLNRDWGTAVYDDYRELILRFSGGHSAHGGSDVLMYNTMTNRWELPFPVEFPLGQLYSNTEYPDGFNFNLRPWVTGHTYQSYGYEPRTHTMLFTGQPGHSYIWDPDVADWTGRLAKPKGMTYGSCFYTLTLCSTPQGLVCWTQQGQVFQFDADKKEWLERKLSGDKLPGSVVDNSTVLYDGKRDRLLFVRKGYGDKVKFDGRLHALDFKMGAVSTLTPKGMEAAVAIPYLCQLRYDGANDLVLVGGTLPPGDDGVRRTPAYDCAADAWVSLKLGGTDPSGKTGRNVSLGLMYDARRRLFWAVDTNSNVFVLRLDPKTADVQPLR